MQLKSLHQRGVAIIAALAILVVMSGLIALMTTRVATETRASGDDVGIVQTLMLARGGANAGGQLLAIQIEDALEEIIAGEAKGDRWRFGGNASGDSPPADRVAEDLAKLSEDLQEEVSNLFCGQELSPQGADATVNLRIYFTVTEACNGDIANNIAIPQDITIPDGRFISGRARAANLEDAQTYAIPFVMVVVANSGQNRRSITSQGEYRFMVGSGSFARYGLFTNNHTGATGNNVWFTSNTLFDGPVHTNGNFRFFNRPWFGGEVTSAGCSDSGDQQCDGDIRSGARYGFGNPSISRAGFASDALLANGTQFTICIAWWSNGSCRETSTTAPELTGGAAWRSDFIPLPDDNVEQENAARGIDTDGSNARTAGLAIANGRLNNDTMHSLTLWAGDEDGDAPTGSDFVNYQYIRACYDDASDCETYRYEDGGVLTRYVETLPGVGAYLPAGANGSVPPADDNGVLLLPVPTFNGVIYVDGEIERFTGPARDPANSDSSDDAAPALASFAQITVSAPDDIRITGDLQYEDEPCTGSPTRLAGGQIQRAVCDNPDARNVLGVYTPDGNVLIGNDNGDNTTNAPDNVTIQGVFMSSNEAVTVENFGSRGDRGTVNLLGGIIEDFYGAFGTFGNGRTGYRRSFTYDQRMQEGLSPPAFPTLGDTELVDIALFSFGQREQLQ